MQRWSSTFTVVTERLYSFLLAILFIAGVADLEALPEIRDCDIEYYDISGGNGNELLAQMHAKNDTKDGFFGVTKYSYKNKCRELSLACKVRLPRWLEFDSSSNDILKQKWEKFYVALVKLHQGHVEIFNAYMSSATLGTENLDCRAATSHFKSRFHEMGLMQKKYSEETDFGFKVGATFSGSTYMGIAYSQKSDVLGWAYDEETKEAATKMAMKNCKAKDCKFTVWASGENRCVSLARGSKGGYGYAYGEGRDDAEAKSVASCAKFDKACAVRKTVCAGQGPME